VTFDGEDPAGTPTDTPAPVSPRKAGNGGGGTIAGDYDFFANIRYPATRRPDVALDKIEQKGGPDAVGYKKRVVHWWPKQGVDVIDVPEGAPLRTWTIRTPEEAPLTEAAYYAKWWPADLRGKKQFDAHLIGFRGIGSAVGNVFADKAQVEALGEGICPAVILLLADGRKRCFTRGSFSNKDQAFIIDLYDKEMARIKANLAPVPTKVRLDSDFADKDFTEIGKPGMYRQESPHFVIVSGSQEADDGVPGTWINEQRPEDSALFRETTFKIYEDFWAYNEYAGHLMPFWEKSEQYKYYIGYGGTKEKGKTNSNRGNGGGYGGCTTACWEGLYHEWGHGFASDPMVLLGGGETRCDAHQVMADPTLLRKVLFGVNWPYKNFFWGQYPGAFGYSVMADDSNWGYASPASFPSLMSEEENTPMHVIARLGEERGIWENGIKGLGDFMGQIGARMAEYDYEIEGMLRETYPQANRALLVALDREKGWYRSSRVEAPEPFGANAVPLNVEPKAKEIVVDFKGLYDPDTYGDWRACIVAVGADSRPRYSPLWNMGKMKIQTREGDKRYWLTVTATPYALAAGREGGGNKINSIYQGGFTYKYPYEVHLKGCRPANPNRPIGANENMNLVGPSLISRAIYTETNCGETDWPHPSDTPEYAEMKRTLEKVQTLGPVMMERLTEPGLYEDGRFCPVVGGKSAAVKAPASAAFLEWRANWLLENAQGARHPNGGGWVAKSAKVAPTAYVGPDCMVLDGAQVLDHAIIEDFAMISGPKVLVKDNARVYGKAVVNGDVTLSGYARVCRDIVNRKSKVKVTRRDDGGLACQFEMTTGEPVLRDGPEERVEVYKDAGFKLQANYAFDRPEKVLLEDWFQEHSVGGFAFGAHSEDLIFYDGILYGEPGFVQEEGVRAFTFNGKNQYAEAEGSVADLGVVTLDLRFKPQTGKRMTLFDFGSSKQNCFMLTLDKAGRPVLTTVRDGKAQEIVASKAARSGAWTSCRVEMDGKRVCLWLDDEKVAEAAAGFRAADAFPAGVEKRNFIAATRHGRSCFKGAIDHLRVYYAVYEDFAQAPEPPMVSSRRIYPGFVESYNAAYPNVEARLEAYWEKVDAGDKNAVLPIIPEHRGQLEDALSFQEGRWATRVDWDGRTRWEKSEEEQQPLFKRWLVRMRDPGVSADHTSRE
jgi:hypothetical protein